MDNAASLLTYSLMPPEVSGRLASPDRYGVHLLLKSQLQKLENRSRYPRYAVANQRSIESMR